jgi:hypothetical protein
MRVYIIGNDGITLCREAPRAVNDGEIAVASNEDLHAAPLSAKRLLALWNALPGVEKRKKVGDRNAYSAHYTSGIRTRLVIQKILGGVSAAAAGLLIATGIKMLMPHRRRPAALFFAALAFAGIIFAKLPLLAVLAGLVPLSIAVAGFMGLRAE